METIATLLAQGSQYLKDQQIDDAVKSARLLLASVLEKDHSFILLDQTNSVSPERAAVYWDLIHRRAKREPVDYLLQSRPFRDLDLTINRYTLIPRSETEQLVELVLDYIAKNWPVDHAQPLRIADIGTGSGAIAVSLAYHLRKRNYNVHIYAADTSAAALHVAEQNAVKYRLEERITFMRSDLLIPSDGNDFPVCDMLIANLPYVPRERIATLEPEVRDYEPILALDGGEDGLDLYRSLLEQLETADWKPETMFFEIDESHGKTIQDLLRHYDAKATVELEKDLAGMDRFVIVK